ncbi:MAG: chloride channel protein [Pirellulales bacterium]
MNGPHDNPPAPSHPLKWFPEFWELSNRRLRPHVRLLGLSILVGVVAGLGAIAFYVACQVVAGYALGAFVGYHPHHPAGEPPMFGEMAAEFRPWLLLVVPAVGGLVSGWLVFTFAPEAEGHGTDAAIASYHFHQGRIRPRVPLVKIFSSALTIGTGGSGGREGPIAQIGAGFGSILGGLLKLSAAERRILMAAGVGAGVAAIFRAPLAGALFAAEVLYSSSDFESEAIVPAALASITAYCIFCLAFGWAALFALPADTLAQLKFTNPLHLLWYFLLALLCVVLAMIYTRSFYSLTHWFKRLPMRPHFKPAIGAFMSAAVGLGLYYMLRQNTSVLSVLSFGYGILQDAMSVDAARSDDLWIALVLFAVAMGKILTTSLTIGSGGSGGVFGPSMVIGGCAGGALGLVLHHFWPAYVPHPAAFVLVGMAGFFAAAAKTPFSTLVIVSEMTGNYNLLLPALFVCMVAFLLSDEQSIYSSQVECKSRSPAHQGDYVLEVLAGMHVRQFLRPHATTPMLHLGDPLRLVVEQLSNSTFHGLPVTDDGGRYLGLVSLDEVHLAAMSAHLQSLIVAEDLMRTDVPPLEPQFTLDRALELFIESDCLDLPVVDDEQSRKIIGIVRRSDISSTYLKHVHRDRASRHEPIVRI